MRCKPLAVLGAVSITTLILATTGNAVADESIIKNPGDHPDYRFEAEPHGLIGFGGPFVGGHSDFGVGFRGTVIIVQNGFVKEINNSVGITFGADIFFDRGNPFLIPVAMQWNFWLSTHWSVFGEPGLVLVPNHDRSRDVIGPAIWVGGRYHFNDKVSLTMRIGYPAFSIGASFFL